jgi:hypothetical protein
VNPAAPDSLDSRLVPGASLHAAVGARPEGTIVNAPPRQEWLPAGAAPDGVDLIDRMVRGVLAATFVLASTQTMVDPASAARLGDVIGDLDHLVIELRHSLASSLRSEETALGQAELAIGDARTVVYQLWLGAQVSGGDADDTTARLASAARLVRLAELALEGDTLW